MKKYFYLFLYLICTFTAQADIFTKNKFARKMPRIAVPIVYSDAYKVGPAGTAWLLSKLHPFDVAKASKIAAILRKEGVRLLTPEREVTHQELLSVHTAAYLALLEQKSAQTFSEIVDGSRDGYIAKLPNWFVDTYMLAPMRWQTAGTLRALDLALRHGWAINLGGGFHHAKQDRGEGFCVYGDIQLAVKGYLDTHENHKVMIIDLDAHRGNGYTSFFLDDSRVVIFDVYGSNNYPLHDQYLCDRINYNHPLEVGRDNNIDDDVYLSLLKRNLARAIETEKPDLIIYNAGTDILADDPIGGMRVSRMGIVQRDALVFAQAFKQAIPIVMLLSGGYTSESYSVIADSIKNILATVDQR